MDFFFRIVGLRYRTLVSCILLTGHISLPFICLFVYGNEHHVEDVLVSIWLSQTARVEMISICGLWVIEGLRFDRPFSLAMT